jgi:formate dehydrogenase major subunit
MVTDRLTPLRIAGRVTHQIWLPYHLGSVGVVTGDSANDLWGVALDPNVLIQESKVATCDIRPGRRPHGPELVEMVDGYRRRAGVTLETGTHLATVGDLKDRLYVDPDARGPLPGHHAGTESGEGLDRASEGSTTHIGTGDAGGDGSEEGR